MQICRIEYNNKVLYAKKEGDLLYPIKGDIFASYEIEKNALNIGDLKLLSPCEPGKIICLGLNYSDHADELGFSLPKEPLIFLKPSSSVINPGETIVKPEDCKRLDYEAELAIVIGKRCKDVPASDYKDVVFGYTCLNDVTARDLQASDDQWTRSKGFDTFCPFGPWIETELNAEDVKVESRLNGKVCQSSRTSKLIHNLGRIVWFASRIMTLMPGDIIATGTPDGIGPMEDGDIIEIEVEGIGVLKNHVKF